MPILAEIGSIGGFLMATPVSGNTLPAQTIATTARRESALHEQAVRLEATFLSEMLKHAGLGEARESFGGGIGEEQFASFLRDEQAGTMARAGGIGLAETIFQALQKGARDA
jgi:Rod binding domain-containing protein